MNRDTDKWEDFQGELGDAKKIVKGAVGRLESMMSLVDNLIQTVNKARLDPEIDTTQEGYRSTFDSYLKSIRSRADYSSDSPNLLGNIGLRDLAIPVSVHGARYSVYQNYMGTSYNITDTEGYVWRPDYAGDLLRRYESYPDDATNISGNLANGLRLDGKTGDEITFTVAPDSAGETQYTGTLTVEGNGIVEAWYYDGLGTEVGRERAMVDLDAAYATLKNQLQSYKGIVTTIEFQEARASKLLKNIGDKTIALALEQEKASAKIQKEGQQQLNAVADAIAFNQAMGSLYVSMFSLYTYDGNSNQLVGNSTAARIFGAFVDMGV